MNLSSTGLELIKSFEGFRDHAYKAVSSEKYYTIGYGHYGPDVKKDDVITRARAEQLLIEDVATACHAVSSMFPDGMLKQCEFDALVDFTYNCGAGNLRKLCAGRSMQQIKDHILEYNKSGGSVLTGLIRRRRAELEMMNGSGKASAAVLVKAFQRFLNGYGYALAVDGIYGPKTDAAWKEFKKRAKI